MTDALFLITGADNNACIDPDSPYAGAFGDRKPPSSAWWRTAGTC